MKAINFLGKNVNIAEHQPEYATLPAFYSSADGTATFCMQLNDVELEQVKKTGQIWLKQYIGQGPFQPIGMSCLKEDNLPVADD